MSTQAVPDPNSLKPHRCAFLIDNILDAMHPYNKDELKTSFRAFRECLRNHEINADLEKRPRYIQVRENYQGKKY